MLALVAFVALVGGALLVTNLPEKGELTGPAPRPLGPVAAAAIDRLEITQGGTAVVLAKSGGAWRLLKPVAAPADAAVVGDAITAVSTLEWGDLVSTQKGKWSTFELTDDKACHVVAKQGGKILADLYFGQVLSGATMARVAGKDDVWQAVGSFRSQLVREPREWRDRQVAQTNAAEVTGLVFERFATAGSTVAGRVELQRTAPAPGTGPHGKPAAPPTAGEWKVVSSSVPLGKLDSAVAEAMVSTLTSLQAHDVADGATPQQTGLGAGGEGPQLRVSLQQKAGPTVSVEVGKARGDKKEDYFVAASQHPGTVYVVKSYALERLLKSPYDFRDKTVLSLPQGDITGLDITLLPTAKPATKEAAPASPASEDNKGSRLVLSRDGATWKAKLPAGLAVEADKITPLLAAASDVQAYSFAANFAAAPNGLDRPTAVVTIETKDGAKKVLKVGKLLNDMEYPVQLSGTPEVYILKRYTLERLLKRPSDVGTLPAAAAAKR
jgi:hypothetical protein